MKIGASLIIFGNIFLFAGVALSWFLVAYFPNVGLVNVAAASIGLWMLGVLARVAGEDYYKLEQWMKDVDKVLPLSPIYRRSE